MPELPEVETTLQGIKPYLTDEIVLNVAVRHPRLRWPIPSQLANILRNQPVLNVTRRAKYLLFSFPLGTLILHLGMSGRLRILSTFVTPNKHDHVDIYFTQKILRFTDPRRFGALLWTEDDPSTHPLLKNLGPEPLTQNFSGEYLFTRSRNKKIAVKSFIMDSKVVAGVGNIYATEALFAAGIHPKKAAFKVDLKHYQLLAKAIKRILRQAIQQGGTTLKDFAKTDGSPGYFSIKLKVYGQSGNPCVKCKSRLHSIRINQRSTVYCKHCQK